MRIAGTVSESIVDGPGLRLTVFTQGCPHRCPGCHNPQTHDFDGGQDIALDTLLKDMCKNPFVKGVTFSGGDPLYPANREQIGALAQEIRARFPDKTIWLYTGYRFEQITDLPFLAAIDVVVDGPCIAAQKDTQLHWRGSANQRVIDVARTLETGAVCLHENTEK